MTHTEDLRDLLIATISVVRTTLQYTQHEAPMAAIEAAEACLWASPPPLASAHAVVTGAKAKPTGVRRSQAVSESMAAAAAHCVAYAAAAMLDGRGPGGGRPITLIEAALKCAARAHEAFAKERQWSLV